MIGLWLEYNELPVSEETRSKLLKISAAQIDRLLSPLKARYPKRLYGSKPGTLIRKEIKKNFMPSPSVSFTFEAFERR